MQNVDKSLELKRREEDVQSAEERLLTRRKAVEADEGEMTDKDWMSLLAYPFWIISSISEFMIKEKPLEALHHLSFHVNAFGDLQLSYQRI